jgi:hypothetical protein
MLNQVDSKGLYMTNKKDLFRAFELIEELNKLRESIGKRDDEYVIDSSLLEEIEQNLLKKFNEELLS